MEIFSNTTNPEDTVIPAERDAAPVVPVRISGLIAEQAGISVHLDTVS